MFHNKTRLLRAGTRSRGVWEVDLSGRPEPDTHVYVSRSAVDTGRNPCADGVADPFHAGGIASWQDSPDILIDAEPYRAPLEADAWLLALVTADNDKLSSSDLDLGILIPKQVKCALKRVRVAG